MRRCCVVCTAQVLFDGHLSSVVVFSYNAKAVDGQLCLEASPVDNGSFFVHSPHATLLEVRCRMFSSMSFCSMIFFVFRGCTLSLPLHSTVPCIHWEEFE